MDPPDIDVEEFSTAVTEYNPLLRDFFTNGEINFSNYKSISQGEVGDCWLLAPLAALSKSPINCILLENNFTINDDNTYTVKLYSTKKKSVQKININGNLYYVPKIPGYKSDLLFAGQQQFIPEKKQPPFESTWYAFIEKAVAILYGGYQMLDGGDPDSPDVKQPDLGFYNLTGKKATTLTIDESTDFKKTIKKLLDEGASIVYTTKSNNELPDGKKIKTSPDDTNDESGLNLLEDHAYVLDSISNDGTIKLYNPHGELPHLQMNKAKSLPTAKAIFFGSRLDILTL